LRSKITSEKPAAAVASTTLFEIFIRFALTICNLVAAHLFGEYLKRFESFKATPRSEIKISKPDNLKFLAPRKPPQPAFHKGFLKAFKEVLGSG
jgi:hypothetical protein